MQKSEAVLAEHAIPINRTLPLIESEADVHLRTADELLHRLIALWAVAGMAFLRGSDFFRRYVTQSDLVECLSTTEREFLLAEQPTEKKIIQAYWQLEGLNFLAWCGGLVDRTDIPLKESSVQSFMHLFPQEGEDLARLRHALVLRSVSEVLDWSDLLHRLLWADRDATLRGSPAPSGVTGGVVQEWPRAVNWLTRYDDWDAVPTDT